MRRTWLSLLAMGAVALGLTTLVSLSLTRVTETMAAGDLTPQITPAGPDEIRRLGRA